MDSVILAVQLALAAVFLTAGVAKLLDLRGARRNLEGFGVPPRAAAAAGPMLAASEFVVGVALIPESTARWGAVGALLLLMTFAVGIVRAMLRGEDPDCGCFGKLYSAPAGGTTLWRNLALAALAVLVVWRGPDISLGDWVAARSAAELAAVGAAAAALALALRLSSKNRALKRALEEAPEAPSKEPGSPGLPVGTPAPGFELSGIRGEQRSLESLRAGGRPVVLVFFDPKCGPCKPLVPRLAQWQASLADKVAIAVIADGSLEATQASWNRYAPGADSEVLLEEKQEVTRAYNIDAWPAAIAVGRDGNIASEPAFWPDTIEALVRRTLDQATASGRPKQASSALSVTTVGGAASDV